MTSSQEITLDSKKCPLIFGTSKAFACIDRTKFELPEDVLDFECHFKPAEYATITLKHRNGQTSEHLLGVVREGFYGPVHEIKEKARTCEPVRLVNARSAEAADAQPARREGALSLHSSQSKEPHA